jgi:hypothetical protein
MNEGDVTRWEDWVDPKHLPPDSVPAISVGLDAEERPQRQEELLQHFRPSLASVILRRAMEQPPQPEIVLIQSDSEPASPQVSSDDSDGDALVPDPDDSGIVQAVSGNGFQIVDPPVDDASSWTLPSFPFYKHVPTPVLPMPPSEWITEADKHILGVDGHHAVFWEQFKNLIVEQRDVKFGVTEQKPHEECTIARGQDNDVIAAFPVVLGRI